ncbi:MAG: cell division protein CrgA [Acidimicrobiales bacterium]
MARMTRAKNRPRGTRSARSASGGRATPRQVSSGRYTPPIPREQRVSPPWVPVLMFALLAAGMAMIILNYLNVLPGGTSNWYLIGGLGAITGGFITSTQLH